MRLDQKTRTAILTLVASVLDATERSRKDNWSDGAVGKEFDVPPGKLRQNRVNIATLNALTNRVERLERAIAEHKNGEDTHAA